MTALEKIVSEWELEYGVTNTKHIIFNPEDHKCWGIEYKNDLENDYFHTFNDMLEFIIADSNAGDV